MIAHDYLSSFVAQLTAGGIDPASLLMYRGVLEAGREHTPAAFPADLPKGKLKECFYNAANLIMADLLAPRSRGLFYVEGYAFTPRLSMPIHHAWCVDRDGNVLDPTWRDPEACAYFGIEMSPEELLEWLTESETYGVLTDSVGALTVPVFARYAPKALAEAQAFRHNRAAAKESQS